MKDVRSAYAPPDKRPEREQREGFLRGHIPALDGVRGLAILMVFVYHYGGVGGATNPVLQFVGQLIRSGWIGVSLFFVLSGFLITGILWSSFDKPNWWRIFYIRRSLRIFPLYYLALIIALAAAIVLGVPAPSLHGLWVFVFYLQNVPSLYPLTNGITSTIYLGHFWSLAVEEQFYLLWPFLLFAFRRNRRSAMWLCVLVFLASLAFRVASDATSAPPGWTIKFLAGRMGELAAGGCLALSLRGSRSQTEAVLRRIPYFVYGSALAWAGVLLWLHGTYEYNERMQEVGIAVETLLCTSVVAACLQRGWIQTFFKLGFLRWLGKISYGVYVWHFMLFPVFHWIVLRAFPNASANLVRSIMLLIAFPGSLAVASLSFYTYERAFLVLKDRWSAQVRAAG